MIIIKLPQDSYSETVVRKSLYWCDPEALWTLEPHEGHWVISVEQPTPTFEADLHKHLNDFLLRERLDAQARSLREELINVSLHAVLPISATLTISPFNFRQISQHHKRLSKGASIACVVLDFKKLFRNFVLAVDIQINYYLYMCKN